MLWEFASAIAPAILGGGFAFAILIINKEKISFGKSISVVMFTSFLDGLFFAIVAPLVYFIAGREGLFSNLNAEAVQQLAHGKELFHPNSFEALATSKLFHSQLGLTDLSQ